MKRRGLISLAGTMILAGVAALLPDKPPPFEPALALSQKLAQRSDIIAAITTQNRRPVQNMAAMDQQWRRDVDQPPAGSLIAQVMATPLSQKLAHIRQSSHGRILKIMVIDQIGALVAADQVTHDYDQSDEDKWQKTVGAQRKKAIYEGQITHQNGIADQISQAVLGPQQQIIGAITLVHCRTPGRCNQ
jgi:hypothetical protein